MERMPTLLGVNFRNSVEWARVAELPEEANQRPPRMAPIPPVAWGTKRDILRAFCPAPARAKAMHGIGVWYTGWPSQRPAPRRIRTHTGRVRIVAGIPKGSRMEDAVLDVKPRPLPDTALARGFRYALRRETRGGALRSGASAVCHPQRPARKPHDPIMARRPALR
ncbi:hypothetical protein C3747_78g46 [Trypanosoma cruzi]|uniref:Uncharacterized protein n=1 Tax=Trypanosoma cruzi TaxID=5693 RepID=A0A2V2WLN2_TRYCR|nr:hypothetical protein C3747_78g40 [Trypanosoma cruzi]PWV09481.1 hypothetical protein C3747_78g46 [Trypanosoma cruzi]